MVIECGVLKWSKKGVLKGMLNFDQCGCTVVIKENAPECYIIVEGNSRKFKFQAKDDHERNQWVKIIA